MIVLTDHQHVVITGLNDNHPDDIDNVSRDFLEKELGLPKCSDRNGSEWYPAPRKRGNETIVYVTLYGTEYGALVFDEIVLELVLDKINNKIAYFKSAKILKL